MLLFLNHFYSSNPTPDPVGVEGSSSIVWPQFNTDNFTYAYLAYASDVRSNYRQMEFAFWEHYLPYISYGETFQRENGMFTSAKIETN